MSNRCYFVSPVLSVRNQVQSVLFACQVRGQLSDGAWENCRPRGHWHIWHDAEIVVDPTNVGRNFYPDKDNYDLTNWNLLKSVGGRMLAYARLGRVFSASDVDRLEVLFDHAGVFRGLPSLDSSASYGAYRLRCRSSIACIGDGDVDATIAKAEAAINDTSYSAEDLRLELRDLARIMRTCRA